MAEKTVVENDSRHRVAYDLMVAVMGAERDIKKDRAYLLTLYSHCLKAVSGYEPAAILKKD
jgi:hypothetical protein